MQVGQVGSHRQYKHPEKSGRVTIAGKPSEDVSEDGAEHLEAGRSDRRCAVSDPQRYVVVFEHSPGMSYGAWVPDLPGVIAAARRSRSTWRACGRTASRSRSRPRSMRRWWTSRRRSRRPRPSRRAILVAAATAAGVGAAQSTAWATGTGVGAAVLAALAPLARTGHRRGDQGGDANTWWPVGGPEATDGTPRTATALAWNRVPGQAFGRSG